MIMCKLVPVLYCIQSLSIVASSALPNTTEVVTEAALKKGSKHNKPSFSQEKNATKKCELKLQQLQQQQKIHVFLYNL